MPDGILEQINEKLDRLLALQGKASKAAAATADEDEDEKDEEEEKPATRKRTRTPSKGTKAKALTADDVKAKLKAVLDGKGRKAALAILEKFDAEKVGDLEEDQYEKFAKACDAAVGGGDEDDDDLDL